MLAQKHPDGHEYMVACISRSLNSYESNYAAYDGELLAAVWATKILRPYLHTAHHSRSSPTIRRSPTCSEPRVWWDATRDGS